MPGCHIEIKINGKEYVDTQTRRKKTISSISSCNDELVMNSNEGWISIWKSLERVHIPNEFPASHSNLAILNFHDH